jgi:glucose-6-phosphate 1-dehydrogenase
LIKFTQYSPNGFNRIVVEKPFGMDLPTSRQLMGNLKALWKEEEVSAMFP